MLVKSPMTGAWVEAGATEWPTPLPDNNQTNHCRHDACSWCGKPKARLFPAPLTDKFGRPSEDRICVVCLGSRHTRPPAAPAQNGGEEKPIPDAPLPQKEYIIKELCGLFHRAQSQMQREVTQRKLGRLCSSGKRPFRVLSWEEAEGLRVEFLRRQQNRVKRQSKPRVVPKMQQYSKPEEEEVIYGK